MRFLIILGFFVILLAAFTTPASSGGHAGYGEGWSATVPFPITSTTGHYQYGTASEDSAILTVDLVEAEGNSYDVVFFNTIVSRGVAEDITFVDEETGFSVHVKLDHGDGDLPDVMTVTPPPGYVAIPAQISVEEGTTGIIEIHELVLG